MRTSPPAVSLWSALVPALALALSACGGPDDASGPPKAGDGKPVVLTVNYPLAYFAERIGGDAFEVRLPAPQDVDPAWWSPDADTVARYQQADLILLNGATYAKWVEKASLPASKTVDTSEAAEDRLIALEEAVTHAHGPEGEHEHLGTAFTTWLDPEIAVLQAKAVERALARLQPDRAEALAERRQALENDLRQVAEEMRTAVAQDPDRPVVFSHPVYQYLERAFGMNGESVHWEPDAEPDETLWKDLERLLEEHPAKVMIWEGEPLDAVVAALRERGLESVVFAPAGAKPKSGDYLSTMRANAKALAEAYR